MEALGLSPHLIANILKLIEVGKQFFFIRHPQVLLTRELTSRLIFAYPFWGNGAESPSFPVDTSDEHQFGVVCRECILVDAVSKFAGEGTE
jgi:hypothetical protein